MKANQVLLTARYSDLERRLLTLLGEGQASIDASHPDGIEAEGRAVQIVWHPMNFEFAMLLRDGLIEEIETPMAKWAVKREFFGPGGKLGSAQYGLTKRGLEFVKRWFESRALDPYETSDE